jgi:EAL domain-containing protein (putative c-di-GMP-specific phosphodiesterase class I)
VSVNVSPRQLVDPTLPSQVASLLDATGLEPSALVLEITESVMLEDPETTMRTLDSLRDLGVRLSIDDFGTGYSSLSYLRRLPVNTVKIDRSFLLQLGHDPHDATIVGAVVDLAHSLGLDVVAEGIETTEQLAELLRLGCDHVQGFLLARPAPGSELVPLLARGGLLAAHLPQRLAG